MNFDEDSTLVELQARISMLKEQRNELMDQLINQRREVEEMQGEMAKMKKEKQYLDGLVKEKTTGCKEYNRIIDESQKTLSKLSQITKKLLLSVDSQYGKYYHK